jgi:hypothetical protein
MVQPIQSRSASAYVPSEVSSQDRDQTLAITCIAIAALGTLCFHMALPWSCAFPATLLLLGSSFLVYQIWNDNMMFSSSSSCALEISAWDDEDNVWGYDLFGRVVSGAVSSLFAGAESVSSGREVVSHPLSGGGERAAVRHR